MRVELHPGAVEELRALQRQSAAESAAMLNAIEKLKAVGVKLGFPHTSHVRDTRLRELRPRAGNSPWRAFYARVGDAMLILSIGPEAQHDQRGFDAAIERATLRLGG